MGLKGEVRDDRSRRVRWLLAEVEAEFELATADARLPESEARALYERLGKAPPAPPAVAGGAKPLVPDDDDPDPVVAGGAKPPVPDDDDPDPPPWSGPQAMQCSEQPLAINDTYPSECPEPPGPGEDICLAMRALVSDATSRESTKEGVEYDESAPSHHLCAIWSEPAGLGRLRRTSSQRSAHPCGSAMVGNVSASARRAGEVLRSRSCMQRFISQPSSRKRITWDLLCVFVMAYELVTIPLQVFDWRHDLTWYALGVVTTCFWTTDLAASFCAGYHNRGLVEMRPHRVAINYLRTWFPLDVIIVSIDWACLIVDFGTNEEFGLLRLNKTLRIVRTLRVLRLLRLLRMLKVWALLGELREMIRSEAALTVMSIAQLLVGVLLLNHYIACFWYGIGVAQITEDPRDSWVTRLQMASGREIDYGYFYTTALHWSLTQFTPASMEVVPANTAERVFTIGVMLFAVILFSSVLSSITASMNMLRNLSAEKRKQVSYVRRYITEKRVTLDLGNRITTFLRQHQYNCSQSYTLHEEQIVAFKILPESLRAHLRCEVYLPALNAHPLFSVLNQVDEAATVSICNDAMSEQSMAVGQEKFAWHTRASHMYICMSGGLEYILGGEVAPPVPVGPAFFISEAVLWVSWEHKGRLVATCATELVALSAASFHATMSRSYSNTLCRDYASRYHRRLAAWEADGQFDLISDIAEVDAETKALVKAAHNVWMESVGASKSRRRLASGIPDGGPSKQRPSDVIKSFTRFISRGSDRSSKSRETDTTFDEQPSGAMKSIARFVNRSNGRSDTEASMFDDCEGQSSG